MNTIVFREIAEFLFGKKYYANIINTRGTTKFELSSFIFQTKEEAMEHKSNLMYGNLSFVYIETVSFRSRKRYYTSPYSSSERQTK